MGLPLLFYSSSCPAKAGHPVITDVSNSTEASRYTGSSAFADDDAVSVETCCVISRGVLGVGGLIHQAVELALVCDLHFEKPGLAGGVGIDQRRLGRELAVDFKHFA